MSNWFANARRRLKKENKMTWVPKNRRKNDSSGGRNEDDDSSPENEDGIAHNFTDFTSKKNSCSFNI